MTIEFGWKVVKHWHWTISSITMIAMVMVEESIMIMSYVQCSRLELRSSEEYDKPIGRRQLFMHWYHQKKSTPSILNTSCCLLLACSSSLCSLRRIFGGFCRSRKMRRHASSYQRSALPPHPPLPFYAYTHVAIASIESEFKEDQSHSFLKAARQSMS